MRYMRYVAFLLGINVGRRVVKMAELMALLESMGLTDVRTVLASGNAVFTAKKTKPEVLAQGLESALHKKFGFEVGVIVRTLDEIQAMHASKPFKGVAVTPQTRLYVTLLSEKSAAAEKQRRITAEYEIRKVTPGAVYSVLELNPKMQTPDVMKLLGKSFGKKITTRNWNTIGKIVGE
jgi:uncharacterized protein (DUF1697 family)